MEGLGAVTELGQNIGSLDWDSGGRQGTGVFTGPGGRQWKLSSQVEVDNHCRYTSSS
jgi:hypothetical protein